MATFKEHIEGLTQISITASSAPTQDELTNFLRDACLDVTNRIIRVNPDELHKFTATTITVSGQSRRGKILSVTRQHDSADILRPCTPISPQFRTEALDVESLHYRSKYNPGWYELDGSIDCVPEPQGSVNQLVVTQVNYDTGLVHGDTYANSGILYMPDDYLYLVGLYAAAQTCHAAAGDIQANMPTKPTTPIVPIFSNANFDLPNPPIMSIPQIKVGFGKIDSLLVQEDLDGVEKAFTRFDKEVEVFNKQMEQDNVHNSKNTEVFKAGVEKIIKDADRELQVQIGEYRELISKYEKDISLYGAEIGEKVTKYKWFMEQYINFMNGYNTGIMSVAQPRPKTQENTSRRKGAR